MESTNHTVKKDSKMLNILKNAVYTGTKKTNLKLRLAS